MYRLRISQEVVYGHYKEFVDLMKELNAVTKQRGLTEFTVWTPSFGNADEIVTESEYPDLATYQREAEAFQSDAEIMKVWRRAMAGGMLVQGSVIAEMFELAPDLA